MWQLRTGILFILLNTGHALIGFGQPILKFDSTTSGRAILEVDSTIFMYDSILAYHEFRDTVWFVNTADYPISITNLYYNDGGFVCTFDRDSIYPGQRGRLFILYEAGIPRTLRRKIEIYTSNAPFSPASGWFYVYGRVVPEETQLSADTLWVQMEKNISGEWLSVPATLYNQGPGHLLFTMGVQHESISVRIESCSDSTKTIQDYYTCLSFPAFNPEECIRIYFTILKTLENGFVLQIPYNREQVLTCIFQLD